MFNRLLIILVLFSFLSCGTQKMMINVTRPAEVNLKDYKKIAIGSIDSPSGYTSQHSMDVADEFAAALFETKKYDVLDRQHMTKLLSEHQLSQTGLIDESTAGELGKFIGSAALIFGRIQTDNYKEETSKKDWVETKTVGKKKNKRKVKVNHTTYYRDGKYNFSVNIKIVDIETSKMLAVKTLETGYNLSTEKVDGAAPGIDRDKLYRWCLEDIKKQFSKMVAPYNVKVAAEFETDSDLPEVKKALTQFKIGEWDEGVKLFRKAANKPGLKTETKAKALYNLGLAEMYGGNHDEALKCFKDALSLNSDSDRYQNAIIKVKKEKKEAEKLKEQS